MINLRRSRAAHPSVDDELRRRALQVVALSVVLMFISLYAIRYAVRTAPNYSSWALVLFIAVVFAAAIRPVTGLYTIAFFALVADRGTVAWFPFNKNLSSRESLLFIGDGLTFSPLEIVIAVALVSWSIGIIGDPGARVIKAPVFNPMCCFTAFVVFGFLYGLSRGGDTRVALFEGRAMFILLPIYVLATNLCGPRELRRLVSIAVVAVVVQSLLALRYLLSLPPAVRNELEDLGEHTAAVQMNMIFILAFALYLYRGGSRGARLLLLLAIVPVGWAYLASQRRAAVVALIVGFGLVVATLWWRHRAKFFSVAPIMLIVLSGYTAAFWNSQGNIGFPAQAIKTVIAPGEATEKDQSSDAYRKAENFDINYTIKAAPIFGIGFGHKFYRPLPLPDTGFFEFNEYIPHNSILWIWIKTGVFGFFSMLMMLTLAIRAGVRSLVHERDPTAAAFQLVGVTYVVMFAIFAFVDIAWDSRNMVFLALAMALCSTGSNAAPANRPSNQESDRTREPAVVG